MTFWLAFALMTAAAVLCVLWPLARAKPALASGADIAVYKDQIEEVARDRAAGLIGAPEAEAARLEISRRLLAAADRSPPDRRTKGEPSRRRAVVAAALLAFPLGGGALYFALGSPGLPDQPLAARLDVPLEHRSIETLVSQVEHHLAQNPEDGRGWDVIAPVYLGLGRFDDAVKARQNAVRLLGDSADREADLGEALAAAANGVVTADAKTAFDRALALDAGSLKARYFVGLAAEQDGRRSDAAGIWRAMLTQAPAGAPWAELVRQSLARVDPPAVPEPPGPGSHDMAAAAHLNPAERSEMVRTMVERLAARLEREGTDVDGWLRLVRSYAVLGERDRARSALGDARRALATEPEKLQRLRELAKDLGLEG